MWYTFDSTEMIQNAKWATVKSVYTAIFFGEVKKEGFVTWWLVLHR